MKITLERVLLIVLALVIAYLLLRDCKGQQSVEKETSTTETVDIKKTIDEAVNNALAKQPAQTRPYIIYPDNHVEEVKNINDVKESDLSNVKELQVYRDTTLLDNATVYTEIAADGKVYLHKVKAEVNEKTVTKTITEKTTVNGSGFYVTGGAYLNDGMKLNTVSAGIDYIYKNDVGIGAGVIYDTSKKEVYYGVKISKKIF